MIQHILAPTDFSENAFHAIKAAILFAEDLDASVTILHTYSVPSSTGMLMSIEHLMYEDAEKEMNALLRKLKNENLNLRLVKTDIIRDEVSIGITTYSTRHGVDLIMMGNKGQSDVASVFFGSVAQNVTQTAKVPVWIVSQKNPLHEHERILFAVEDQEQLDKVKTFPLMEIARNYQARIHFLRVIIDEEKDQSKIPVPPSFQNVDTESATIHSNDIGESITAYATEHNIHMICVIRKKRNWWQKLFSDTIIDNKLFQHTNLNVLLLHEVY